MHVEIQVALNFLISFLYNKLPRRRVNQFGEELESLLKVKFEGHWYPDKPYKGSAFRCIKTTPPLDPIFETAARECGMELSDIQENLAPELSIWIDPGEVSYRMSEKGPVKILYSESERGFDPENPDREVTRTFNPEAQCFKPVDSITSQFGSLSMSVGNGPSSPFGASPPLYKSCNGTPTGFISKSLNPTFTTATFAQTKFGSTKLKTNGKRSHRMSPTEFSNYIKQRALLQQQAQQTAIGVSPPLSAPSYSAASTSTAVSGSPHTSRSISPVQNPLDPVNNFMLMANPSSSLSSSSPSTTSSSGFGSQSHYSSLASPNSSRSFSSGMFESNLADLLGSNLHKGQQQQQQQQQQSNALSRFASFLDKASPYVSVPTTSTSPSNGLSVGFTGFGDESPTATSPNNNAAKAFDNFNFNGVSYPNQYQHLLVAN
ncbi:protein Tob1-like protein [Dinothrombium tinctorium]|uniref:Protein Tob1-like protein n=1 Tax=Dinothrombium tinctorium TaxID=1965070 RepID=A0A3S3P4M8_9ACAR|nr:protein Tob1-like protein [Dinothrombium tinctorium]